MRSHTRAFWAPKSGYAENEYEDSYFFDESNDGYSDASPQRFAIADGATQALYSGIWARLLATAWGKGELNFPLSVEAELDQLSQQWTQKVQTTQLPWWAEAKFQNGSFAALGGLLLAEDADCQCWEFQAVGDSCLYLIEQDKVVFSGPLTTSNQFGFNPYLIASRALKVDPPLIG